MPMSGRVARRTGSMSFMGSAVDAITLSSPRWGRLATRSGGAGGERVRDTLRRLSGDPSQIAPFTDMWPEICSEGDTYEAAYAAAPYLVDFARRTPTDASAEYLVGLGLIARGRGTPPPDLAPAYAAACADGLVLALERLSVCRTDHTLRYLLATVSTLRGRGDLGSLLQDLDTISADCESCGAVAFPHELQDVVARDRRVQGTRG